MKRKRHNFDPETQKLFLSKSARRAALAALPIEEKIKLLVELQQLASEITDSTGRVSKKPWKIKQKTV